MCKKLGAYPNCQCPGFAGDPASPCPNDHFVGCVKENTAAFLMQMKSSSM